MTLTINSKYIKDKENLNSTKTSAFKELIIRANKVLNTTKAPFHSVIYKTETPPSGDKHDYMSLAPYWWPDYRANTYVPRDGEINPASKTMEYDGARIENFANELMDLALAFEMTGEFRYKNHGELLLRTWFLANETKMNPNLKFAQCIPGLSSSSLEGTGGRGVGLIDARHFAIIIDSLLLLQVHNVEDYREWFKEYHLWLVNSNHSKEEDAQNNAHGTFYDAHVTLLALFLDAKELALMRVLRAASRIELQMDIRGQQPNEELRKDDKYWKCMNLCEFMKLVNYGKYVDTVVWNSKLLKSVDLLALEFCNEPDKFTSESQNLLISILLQTRQEYGSRVEVDNALKMLMAVNSRAREWLLY